MFRLTTLRAAAAIAALGAMALAGCGGGGSQSMLPGAANAATAPAGNSPTLVTQNGKTVQAAQLSVTLPNQVGVQTQSTKRAILSNAKKPAFIDTTTQNSSLVVSVSPDNAAEAAQYGNLTVCYNLYVNGTLQPTNLPNYQVTAVGNTVSTVTLAIPAPPGTDGFQITQYNGLCGSTPYSLPTPPPGNTGASNILAQTPVTYADIEPGVLNQLNNQIANCPGGSATVLCPAVLAGPAAPPAGTFAAAVTVASVAFGTVPITNPVREQGNFVFTNGKIGIPIPLEAKDAAGSVIPGLTTVASPLGGAGFFPSGVTVTDGDASGHTSLFLVDASTGAIAQGPGTSVTIHEFNVLNSNTVTGFSNTCGTGAQSCSDTLVGGNAGDPWVIVLTSDGTSTATTPASITVTAAATVANAALPTPITTTITPQAAVYSAGGTGYADPANPTAPAGMIAVGASSYFTDGNSVKIDGVAPGVATTATALGGLTSATWPNATSFIYAVDSAQAGAASGTEQAFGLFAYNAALTTAVPVSAQAGANNYVTFQNPVAVVQGLGAGAGAGHPYLYVINQAGGIYRVDISGASEVAPVGGFQEATSVLPLLSQSGTALSPGTVKVLGTAALTGGQFLIGDPGNNRIAMVDATAGNTATITTWATCPGCTGLFISGTSAYATSTSGQIYYISAQGATAVSLGFALGTAVDGPLGQIASFTPTATPTLTPVNYLLQFQSKSFFDTVGPTTTGLAAPYTLAPFGGSKVFATAPAAGVGLIADTSAGGTTGTGVIKATGGIIEVPNTAAASAVVTPDSILFVDSAGVGGKIRTIAR
jgi:hypothetical protein